MGLEIQILMQKSNSVGKIPIQTLMQAQMYFHTRHSPSVWNKSSMSDRDRNNINNRM